MATALPPIDRAALLLDVDGTLLDFAPTPMAVVVPPGLSDALRDVKRRLGGALGMISGRPVEQVAALFGDVPHAIAGEHGGALRHAPGEPIERPALPMVPADWLVRAERLAKDHPGALLEHKAHGFALHYRNAPQAGLALHDALAAMITDVNDFDLMPAHMTWEVRPRGADKGAALKALMQRAPFARRIPVFVGDDVTDEDAIRAARSMGGVGLMVADEFGRPADVRAWIAHAAQHGW
ncbi:MAG: trehalose-phosphatase [Acetobacteraceae bacterium]